MKYILIFLCCLSVACVQYKPDSGYVTQDDPIKTKCEDEYKVIFNNSGEWNTGEGC